uniref:Reverse transcriptase Ty1/copia-type domain-containing protein n=1 Tax=Lactuca sativa TaxID=4236 RepID=A0A9R1WXZ7_LACSA|nr:hypothetical protein LSAT_V11C800424960 [Lactuca sativa]
MVYDKHLKTGTKSSHIHSLILVLNFVAILIYIDDVIIMGSDDTKNSVTQITSTRTLQHKGYRACKTSIKLKQIYIRHCLKYWTIRLLTKSFSHFPMETNLHLDQVAHDIVYVVNMLSQFVSDLHQMHIDASIRVMHYLKATPEQGIILLISGRLT